MSETRYLVSYFLNGLLTLSTRFLVGRGNQASNPAGAGVQLSPFSGSGQDLISIKRK